MKKVQFQPKYNFDFSKGGYLYKPKDAWEALTLEEKSEMMKVAVRNGITDLKAIREKYNGFAKGGYLDWKEKANKYKHLDIDNDRTYDYEGWYNENPQRAWDFLNDSPDAHFDDKYKTVYHPTFSTQSKYSGKKDATYNPLGLVGGTWNKQGTVFTMSPDGYRGPVSMDERAWYLMNAEDNGVQLREADGSLPVFDGIPWGGVLPNIIINGSRRGRKFEDGGFTSELDWSPDSWFSKRVAKPDGTLYNDEEAARLASHVPEYNNIEQTAKANGTWLKMPDGSIWEGDPRSWVMMQSEAYKKNYSPKPWYTGQAEWPTTFDYGKGKVDTNKVTRAPYYNNQMWFSDSKDYGQTFADYQNSTGLGWRFDTPGEEDIKGYNFLSAIPKEGNYRTLESPANGRPDQWQRLPFVLEDGTINRLPESQISVDSKGRNIRADKQKVLTDDVVNWSKDLGDQGIFMQNIDDGAIIKNGEILRQPVNEFISQPGFTDKVKFIEGNTGDFDIDNPYKYANNFHTKDSSLDNNYAALGGPIVEAAMNEYKHGGKIYIKPSHRGRLTELKKRTRKTEAELYRTGGPAVRKMITFARSARKWKHGLGGNLFSGEEEGSQQMDKPNIFRRPNNSYFYQANPESEEVNLTPVNTVFDNPALWTFTDDAGRIYTPRQKPVAVQDTIAKAPNKDRLGRVIDNYIGELKYDLNNGVPVGGKYTMPAIAANALLPLAGEAAYPILTNPFVDAGLTSGFAAHGLHHTLFEGLDGPVDGAMTALEVAPLVGKAFPFLLNTGNKLTQYTRLNKVYGGVPHEQVKGGTDYMDEVFPKTHNKHTVWTSNDPDYARTGTWSKHPVNTVFDVYYDPKELSVLETPQVPEGQMVYWQGLPYKTENGKVVYADNINITAPYNIAKNKNLALSGKDSYGNYKPEVKGNYIEKDGEFSRVKSFFTNGWDKINGNIKTDDIVKYSRDNGYSATTFNKVYDGGVDINGEYFDYPIDEVVFNPQAPKYVLLHDTPKWKVFNQLLDKYDYNKYPFWHFSLPTLLTNSDNNE